MGPLASGGRQRLAFAVASQIVAPARLSDRFALDGRRADLFGQQGGWDHVILDLSLPRVDGLEVLQGLRSGRDAPRC